MRWISSLDTPKSTLSWPFIGVELKSGSIVPVGFVCFVFVIEVVLLHTVEFIGGDCVAIIESMRVSEIGNVSNMCKQGEEVRLTVYLTQRCIPGQTGATKTELYFILNLKRN